GAGPGSTILYKINGAKARISKFQIVDLSYSFESIPVLVVGPSFYPGPANSTSQNLTVDGAQGAYSVTVTNASGVTPGQFVLVDEKSGASWQPSPVGFPNNAKVWRSDRVAYNMHYPHDSGGDDAANSNANGPYNTTPGVLPESMGWFSRFDRPTN